MYIPTFPLCKHLWRGKRCFIGHVNFKWLYSSQFWTWVAQRGCGAQIATSVNITKLCWTPLHEGDLLHARMCDGASAHPWEKWRGTNHEFTKLYCSNMGASEWRLGLYHVLIDVRKALPRCKSARCAPKPMAHTNCWRIAKQGQNSNFALVWSILVYTRGFEFVRGTTVCCAFNSGVLFTPKVV